MQHIQNPGRTAHSERIRIAVADEKERKTIYHLRHSVYAEELRQFTRNDQALLQDKLDEHNIYLVAKEGAIVIGFISITPPHAPSFPLISTLSVSRCLFGLRKIPSNSAY